MQVTGIGWAGMLTEDFEATLRFFADDLRLSLAYRDEEKELAHFRFRSGQLFEIYGPSNRRRKEKYRWFDGPALGFEVDNIQLARQEMVNRGARFITDLEAWEDDMWSLFLGPEERLFEILKPTRRPATSFGNVSGICSARVFVQNFAGAIEFFRQIMDMPLTRNDEGREIARCQLPAGNLFEISGSSGRLDDRLPPIMIGFEVDDMAQARGEMESRGVEMIGPSAIMENGRTRGLLCAPDGFIYELVDKLRHGSR